MCDNLPRKEDPSVAPSWGKKFTHTVNRGASDPRSEFQYGQIDSAGARTVIENHVRDERDTLRAALSPFMNVLVIDIGGTQVKALATGQRVEREFVSGLILTPRKMVSKVRKLVADWDYDVVSIGYPGLVSQNRPLADPWNLGKGWAGFNFEAAFKRPVKVVNDAAMQALGSYKRGKMLFLGLGTGLGSCLIVNGIIEPMELGHLPYRHATFEDYVGIRGLNKYGKQQWRHYVADAVRRLIAALEPDDVVLGGGNVHNLKKLPPGCRAGDNANAFLGGFRLWQNGGSHKTFTRLRAPQKIQFNADRQKQQKHKSSRRR